MRLPWAFAGELTTISHRDGSTEVAYNGIPLYYCAKDQQPGDSTGQGGDGVWLVVAPDTQLGAVVTPVASSPASSAAPPETGGTVDVQLVELTVAASVTTLTVGRAYTFTAPNAGALPHEMVVERAGAMDELLEAAGQAAGVGPPSGREWFGHRHVP